ncbi:unnamed protein product (macronuclear) [Paramecium tetraurelia]|uniref:EF-hand domain-containing protein n=1 Tax=Paramecium tetraurelia TaxID=5888 RepID=A0BH33_PARTE|nr:uncharacterized protein GSPATT00028885001 [Paramecium tetraurelia]CAK57850.1 unnamed protein product [Paramecium tetraurelia]|eukprot:XP_001425248.1 hypothetical protein (macronuclear) [Paramecium tetraurelia strain d4-2]
MQTDTNQPNIKQRIEKSKTISQSSYYQSPILKDIQLDYIDRLKKMDKNDFFAQLNSQDPYKYPKKLEGLQFITSNKISQAQVILPSELTDRTIQLTKFSSNLTKRVVKDKIHRGIPLKHDVKALAAWTDLMLEQAIEKNQGQSANIYEDLQQIFSLCLKELIRQISFDCIEKSVLLEKIWTQYIDINTSVYQSILNQNNILEKDHLSEVMRTHQLYQAEIDKYLIIQKKQKTDMDSVLERFVKLKANAKYLKKNNRYLNTQIRNQKNEIQELKNENKQYIDQIEKITDELQDYQRNVQQQFEQFSIQAQKQQRNETNFEHENQLKSKLVRAGTERRITVHQIPQYKLPEIKPIQRANGLQFEKVDSDQDKLKKVLNDSLSVGDIEILLEEKATDTCDLIQILQLTREAEIQTIERKKLSIQIPKFELKDRRQQIIQTEISFLNRISKSVQTDLTEELQESIKMEEQHLEQLQVAIQRARDQYLKIFNQTQNCEQPQIQAIFDLFEEFQSKLKENLHQQKETRTNLILVNSTFKDENTRKEQQLQQYQKRVSELEKNNDLVNQEMVELEAQLDLYEKINEKIEKKYQRIKSVKSNLVDKTKTLVVQLTQTHKFAEIMKKKIQDKRMSSITPMQITPKSRFSNVQPQIIQQNLSIIPPQIIINEQVDSQNQQENINQNPERNRKSVMPQQQQQQQQQPFQNEKNQNCQYNISILPLQDNQTAQQFSQQQQSNQFLSEDDTNELQQNSARNKNLNKPRPSQRMQTPINQAKKKELKTQKRGSMMPQQNEQVQYLQDTISNFIYQNFSSSDSDSEDSEYTLKLQEIKQRKKQINQTKKFQFSQVPKFQNKQSLDSPGLSYLKTNLVKQLATKFASTNQKDIVAKMKKGAVLKLIQQFYGEKLKQNQNKTSLHILCYEYFFNTYGFKNIAEQKLINFYESIFVHRDNMRVNLFGRFLQLFSSLTLDDLDIYIKTLKQLDEDNQTLNTDKGYFILVEKAILILETIHSQIPQEYRSNITYDIKLNYIERNMRPYIDYDYYISRILTGYEIIKKMHMKHYQEVFNSADMDLDNMMEYQEFKKLYYYFEVNQGNQTSISVMEREFLSRCDLTANNEGEKAMSFDRFLTFSIEQNLFSEEKFTNFANSVDEQDPIKTLEDLYRNWNDVKLRLENRVQYAVEEEIEYYLSVIKKLDKALTCEDKRQSIWISYRIIDNDTRLIYINKLVDELVPQGFNEVKEALNYSSDDNY